MAFTLNIPQTGADPLPIPIDAGETLFVLGANGTGKSSLMQKLHTDFHQNSRRILAHRQIWFESNTNDLTPTRRHNAEQNLYFSDTSIESRWTDSNPMGRAGIALYDLIDAENTRARDITTAVDADNFDLVKELRKKDAPIKTINKLLKLSNLPIEITTEEQERIIARKNGGEPYSIAELSDGERNTLLIAATVLTAKKDTLFIIDEPERHLHRSITSPLLNGLFAERPDCAFIVSTHDVMLPLDNTTSKTLLVRSCEYNGRQVQSWEMDLVPPEYELEEELKRDILGARRKILFVEGTETSLDKQLYSRIAPEFSIIPKASCRDVEKAVTSITATANLHWLASKGIIDNDGRSAADIATLKGQGIYALPYYSIESIYYHPEIIKRLAVRQAEVTGEDAEIMFNNAEDAALTVLSREGNRLCVRSCLKIWVKHTAS